MSSRTFQILVQSVTLLIHQVLSILFIVEPQDLAMGVIQDSNTHHTSRALIEASSSILAPVSLAAIPPPTSTFRDPDPNQMEQPSSISKLPPEILGKIFIDSLPDIDDVWEAAQKITKEVRWQYLESTMPLQAAEYLVPFTVSAVCRYWNEVALAAPHLWSCIVIDLAKLDSAGLEALETWFERSGTAPLTLIFASTGYPKEYPQHISQYLSLIFAHIERWDHLYIVFHLPSWYSGDLDSKSTRSWSISTLVQGLSAPLLRSAYICVDTDTQYLEDEPHALIITPLRRTLLDIIFSHRTTRLRQVYLDSMKFKSLSHPASSTFPSGQSITKLIVHGIERTRTITRLLLLCPNVQDLTLSIGEDTRRLAANDRTIFLPYLHRFDIICDEDLSVERIFSRLDAPALSHLQMVIFSARSNRRLRDTFTTFFVRSGCHIASLGLHLYGNDQTIPRDDDFPLPLNEEYWKHLEESDIKRISHPKVVNMHSISPTLNKMALGLPLSGHAEDVCYPNLRQMFVRAQADLGEPDYSVLSGIEAPRLEKFILWWRPPDRNWNAPNWSGLAVEQLLSKAGNLSHLCLACEPIQDDPTDPELLSSYLLDILRLPNVNSNLQTLILCGRGIVLSNTVIEHLALSCSKDLDAAMPSLRDIVLINTTMVSDDGKLADMVASRFRHGSLESFHVHLDAFIGKALPKEIQEPSLLHDEDERKLTMLKQEDRDVIFERGKIWYKLCDMIERLDEELQDVISRQFGKFSLTKV